MARGPWPGRLLKIAIALVVLLAVAITGGWWWLRSGGQPQRAGEARLAGLDGPVEVRWDRWAVPHVKAESEADLARAVGYLHANDRFTQMELGRRAATGRLSELVGRAALPADQYFRRFQFRPSAERALAALEPASRLWLEGYAEGVNAWLTERGGDLPPGLRMLGAAPEPWKPIDSIYFGHMMVHNLAFVAGRLEEVRYILLARMGEEAVRDLVGEEDLFIAPEILAWAEAGGPPAELAPAGAEAPDPAGDETADAADVDAENAADATKIADVGLGADGALGVPDVLGASAATGVGGGSNNWAVGASRSASGGPLMANDPHLTMELPSTWFEVHLRAPGFEARGMTIPGTPVVVIGQSAELAWSVTNTMLDDYDFFFEILDESGERVRRGDAWVDLDIREEEILLKGGEVETVTIRTSDRGPVLEPSPERGLPARSMAWTIYEGGDPFSAFLGLAQAADLGTARDAIAHYPGPAQNLLVADRDGDLMLTVLGRTPQRRVGDGRLPSPAWVESYGWDGLRPQSANPTVWREDALWSANNDIRDLLVSDDQMQDGEMQDDEMPDGEMPDAETQGGGAPEGEMRDAVAEAAFTADTPFVADFEVPYRAARIAEILDERPSWTVEDMAAMQVDQVSLFARLVVELVGAEGWDGDAGRAAAALEGWDGDMAPSGQAALYSLLRHHLGVEIFGDERETYDVEALQYLASDEKLERVLRGEMRAAWLDDVTTPEVEDRRAILGRALAAAWADGSARWGDDVATWSWGELHPLSLSHALGQIPLLGGWWTRGPFPVGGSGTTVGAFGGHEMAEGGAIPVIFGPSMRVVFDTADGDRSVAVLPGGQSGHPADPHYDDQLTLFLDGSTRPLAWSEEAISAATVETLRLVP